MKKTLTILLLAGLSFSLSLTAQTGSSKTKGQSGTPATLIGNSAKSSYIANQEYLMASSNVPSKNVYGDSLKGFDEAGIKNSLLARGLSGKEIYGHVLHLKREYINKKYNLGSSAKLSSIITGAVQPSTGGSGNIGGKPIGGGANVNIAPCVNEDFESTTAGTYNTGNAVSGWSITSRTNNSQCNPTNWNSGSSEFEIMQTPIFNYPGAGTIPNSPLGGSNVARLNDYGPNSNNYSMTRLTQTFPVTSANTLFQFAYAGYWEDGGGGHYCCPTSYDQPGVNVQMYDCNNNILTCSNLSLSPGSGCQSTGVTFTVTNFASWTNWQVKYIDLTPYIGSCVTIEIITTDCGFGGHYGSTLVDCKCGGQLIGQGLGGSGGSIAGPVSYCSGSGVAQISAPLGYSTYSWVAPPGSPSISAAQATLSTITITNPVAYSVYTVNLVAASGCVFTSTNVIAPSVVNIAGIGSSSTCAGGSSGSGTVVGNGSGSGYNYTWTAASNGSVVGTSSVVNNLTAGLYSVTITGFGAAGCGSATGTIQVATAPPGVINLLKPFCGTEAYLSTLGGTNFQWYNNLTAISATAGGTLPTYTVQNPCNGCLFHLRYTSFQGCNDSIKYTLVSSPPGYMQPTNIPPICVGGTNGSAVIQLSPAVGAPAGMNTFSVWSLGTITPVYNATLSGAATSFTVNGLSAGGYSVYAFDGSCKYSSNFSVTPLVWSYSTSVSSASTCPGGSVATNVVHQYPPAPGQYTYSWSPTTWLFGSINTTSSTLMFPTTPVGSSTSIIYTIVVTPTLVNCPIVKTITVTTFSPKIPTITPIPNLCNNSALYTVTVNPSGGTFITTNTNSPISSSGGVINPANAAIGVNSFTYSASMYTCAATQTGSFHVSQFVSSALTSGTITPLCVTSPAYNLNNIVQNSGGTWLKGIPPASTVIAGGSLLPSGYNISTNPVTGNYPITYSTNSTPIATVCPSYTTINVTITRTTTPYISPKSEFCTNASPFSMTVNPTGGGWSSAVNGLINNSGLVTPSSASAAIPAAQVTYTVFDGPCLNTATSTLNVSKFVSAGLSGVVPNMCYNSAAFNLLSIAQNSTGTWLYDPALNPNYTSTVSAMVQNNLASPIGIPTGTFILKYKTTSFPNAALCPDATTITAQVLNPPTPTITSIPAMCNNASALQLTVTPATGYWTSTSYLNNTGVFTPSLSQVGSNAVQYMVGTSTCHRSQTQYINVEAFVSAEVLSTVPDQCNNNPALNLTPLTVNNLGTWTGPGINGNSFNPANTGSGQFILTYATASYPSGLCPDQSTVAVNVYSLASPVVTQLGPFCSTALPFKLQVTPLGGTFNGAGINIVDNDGVFHPSSALPGPNIVSYSISSGPCLAYAQTTINVDKFISAEMEQFGPYCKNVDPINLNTFAQNQGGEWMGDGVIPGTSMFHPSKTTSEYITVTHVTHSEPTGLCSDTKTISVYVRAPQEARASVVVAENCMPVEAVFNSSNSNAAGSKGTWSFGDGSEGGSGLANVSHVYSTPGTYVATFNYVDEMGCKSTPVEVNPVIVYELPKPDFTLPDEIFISDPQVQMTNLTNVLTNNTYAWRIAGVTTDPVSDVNPVMEFPKIGKYTITLEATSLNGCKNEISKTVEVKNNFNIFIPNSFSPNFDGLNDVFAPVFTPYGLDLKSFEMEIFDRWGHSLYRTKDVGKGWDGSIQNKGEPLKEEVYIYRIKYKDLDGNSYNKMGHVSLVK